MSSVSRSSRDIRDIGIRDIDSTFVTCLFVLTLVRHVHICPYTLGLTLGAQWDRFHSFSCVDRVAHVFPIFPCALDFTLGRWDRQAIADAEGKFKTDVAELQANYAKLQADKDAQVRLSLHFRRCRCSSCSVQLSVSSIEL